KRTLLGWWRRCGCAAERKAAEMMMWRDGGVRVSVAVEGGVWQDDGDVIGGGGCGGGLGGGGGAWWRVVWWIE
nr:hypothetical protein [Tanacetum cinerariifolium]GFA28455.1 hypothetical protein [Tanacetum cinerariifolium]